MFKTLLCQPIAAHRVCRTRRVIQQGTRTSESRSPAASTSILDCLDVATPATTPRRFPDWDPAVLAVLCQLDWVHTHLRDKGTPLGGSERIIEGERPALTVEGTTPKSRQNKVGRRTAVERLPSSLSDPRPTECALLHHAFPLGEKEPPEAMSHRRFPRL